MVPGVAIVLALLYLWSLPLPWLRDGAIYVSPKGSDWSTGRSRESALATIQRAADLVAPGERVVILPGVYRETVRVRRGGEPGRPVTFRAETPGTVTITGAAPDSVAEALEWLPERGGLWSARSPWPIYGVQVDGLNLYHVRWGDSRLSEGERRKKDVLRRILARPGAWPAFAHEDDRLYLALPDGESPEGHEIVLHRPIPPPYASWTIRSANVWVETDHIEFEGLRFELGVGTGLLLWSARDVTVRDCLFSGATTGIRSFPSIGEPDGLVIERSLYHNYPQAHWLEGWLDWKEIYRHHDKSSLVRVAARNVQVRGNIVAHAGDGLHLTTPRNRGEPGIRIQDNLFFRGTDDALELDGYGRGILVRRNLIYDHFVGVSLSPLRGGPVHIEENLFLAPEGGLAGAHLKFLHPHGGVTRDVEVARNVFVGGSAAWSRSPIENVSVHDNVFAVATGGTRWARGIALSGNEWSKLPDGYGNPGADCAWAGRLPGVQPRAVGRQGPRWLDWSTLPATAEIEDALAAEVIEWRCD